MIILTLVSTIAASMVWQQWRAIQVEAAERARTQSTWILNGALDWARLILAEDLRPGSKPVDHLGEPWAVPLAEARLSSFLAADRDNSAEGGPEAFLAGVITDASARFNLYHLVPAEPDKLPTEQIAIFRKLCELVAVPQSTADRIVDGLTRANARAPDAPLMPRNVAQLAWLGVEEADLRRLEPHVAFLARDPQAKVNVNTASREVLAAVTDTDLALGDRLVQARQREPFEGVENLERWGVPAGRVQFLDVKSRYFEVQGEVRLGERVLRERSLVQRNDRRNVLVLRRERVNLVSTGR